MAEPSIPVSNLLQMLRLSASLIIVYMSGVHLDFEGKGCFMTRGAMRDMSPHVLH